MSLLCRLGIHKERKKYNYFPSRRKATECTIVVSCARCHFILGTSNFKGLGGPGSILRRTS